MSHELVAARAPVEVRLHVPGRPVAKGRPRMTRAGRVYTPAPTRAYGDLVAAAWMDAGRRRLPDLAPFALYAEFAFTRPKSHYRTEARLVRPDAPVLPRADTDNLCKAILDSLQGLAFADDRLCGEIHATKRWAAAGEAARAAVVLRAV